MQDWIFFSWLPPKSVNVKFICFSCLFPTAPLFVWIITTRSLIWVDSVETLFVNCSATPFTTSRTFVFSNSLFSWWPVRNDLGKNLFGCSENFWMFWQNWISLCLSFLLSAYGTSFHLTLHNWSHLPNKFLFWKWRWRRSMVCHWVLDKGVLC